MFRVRQTFTILTTYMGINLKDITQGVTYVWRLEFYEDEAMQTVRDVSGHSFSFIAENSSGTNVITLSNSDFVQTSTSIRTVTLSAATTAGYSPAVLSFQLKVVLPDSTVEIWESGNVTVKAQIV